MEVIETLFSKDNEIVEKLQEYSYILDYNKIFFEHLGPELKKIFINKKDKIILKNFLEASQYEYGFLDTKIDLSKALSIYKKYADLNDYFCMYKMHLIYLCEYEKFNVPLSRVLEKIYLLKCFAYLPNYIDDWGLKLFEAIDIKLEIKQMLALEDKKLENHQLFFELLYNEKEKYNLSENDINLMKGVLFCNFSEEGIDSQIISFCTLNSLIPENEFDYAYYNAKNKCCYYRTNLKLENFLSDSDIEKFYKEIEDKKLYEFYGDYGNYLLDKNIRTTPEIIELIISSANEGYLFNSFRAYQCLLDFYGFDEIMQDYNKASTILNYLLDEIVFEKLSFSYFSLLTGFLIKYSKFPEKIISNYLIYVKEVNDFISATLTKIEKENQVFKDQEYYYAIKAYIYYFGFKGIEEQNFLKAIELLDKSNSITNKIYVQKNNEFFKYIIKKSMPSVSSDELKKAKKELIEFYYKNLNLKYQIVDRYIIGEDFFEGITRKKDDFCGLLIFNSTEKIFCSNVLDCFSKGLIKKFVKDYDGKAENKYKDDTCCICYTNKVSKIFIPCKHNFCDFCADKLEKESNKCPVCRTEYLCIL